MQSGDRGARLPPEESSRGQVPLARQPDFVVAYTTRMEAAGVSIVRPETRSVFWICHSALTFVGSVETQLAVLGRRLGVGHMLVFSGVGLYPRWRIL